MGFRGLFLILSNFGPPLEKEIAKSAVKLHRIADGDFLAELTKFPSDIG
jgi:hypothetical protein